MIMVAKEKLASLSMGYCISLMEIRGRQYCITASEERNGELLLIDTQIKQVRKITGLSGGVMSILPLPEEDGAFLAIQRFYPIFDSKEAEIVYCRLDNLRGETLTASVRTVAKLPYVHRIALTGRAGARKVVAATLCREKEYTDDWSEPGAVYEYCLDDALQVTGKRVLLEGIHRNHGMYTYRKEGGSFLLIAGDEGVWAVDGQGAAQKFCEEPVSDLCLYDVDGDGVDEMMCITPFHGDTLKIMKKRGAGWETLAERPLNFGHAVWCGPCDGLPIILCCSRGGDRNTTLYHPVWDGKALQLEEETVDMDVGASNMIVQEQGETVVVYAANHGRNETARYTIQL